MGVGKDEAPKADPMIGQAAKDNVALGKEWLSFAREQYGVANERQKGVDALNKEVIGQQLADSKKASERSDQMWSRYEKLFMPAEERLVKDAMEYDSPERREAEAAKAKASVLSAADEAKASRTREMAAMGIDPRSGRYAGVEREGDMSTALASADAQNKARERVEMTGMALREGVANMGRGATSDSATQTSLSVNTGNSAVGNKLSGEGNFRANTGIMTSGFQGGIGANASGAGIMNNLHQSNLNSWNAQNQNEAAAWNGIGNLAGTATALTAALMPSSKDYKEDKEPVDGALDALNSMPVEQWSYKEGIGDGGHHIGPYAEDFKAATGKGDGRSIPLQDSIGLTMRAVQELSKKVDKMAASQGA